MATVAAVATFPDEAGAWLDYLARVTRWTVGARCAASRVVAVGRFDAATDTLGAAEIIAGQAVGGSIGLVLPRPAGAGAPTRFPLPADGDRTLAFLAQRAELQRWRPLDAPGALVPEWATENLDSDVGVARWFAGLPTDPPERAQALATAVRDAGAAERPSAVRAIGDEGLDSAADALQEAAAEDTTKPDVATLAAVALWLLGRRPAAIEEFEAIVRRVGDAEFRSFWQVQRTLDSESPVTLYGPDPDGWSHS